jgi:hypothetical protein
MAATSTLDPATVLAIYQAVLSQAQASGNFDASTDHDSLNPPGQGASASLIVQSLEPIGRASGLASTSGRLEFVLRIEMPREAQPSGQSEKTLICAVVAFMAACTAGFELPAVPEGIVRCIDLLGMYGEPLKAVFGWFDHSEGRYRGAEITVPIILNDIFVQSAGS